MAAQTREEFATPQIWPEAYLIVELKHAFANARGTGRPVFGK